MSQAAQASQCLEIVPSIVVCEWHNSQCARFTPHKCHHEHPGPLLLGGWGCVDVNLLDAACLIVLVLLVKLTNRVLLRLVLG